MKSKILWLSRHTPCKKEVEALKKLYGNCLIKIINKVDLKKVIKEYINEGYTDMVVILPLGMVRKLVECGIHPLYPVTEKLPKNEQEFDFYYRGGKYKFIEFKRVKSVDLVLEDVKNKGKQK